MTLSGKREIVAIVLSLGFALTGCTRSPEERSANWVHSAKTDIQRKDYSPAIIKLQNALQATPKRAEVHYQMGLALLGRGLPNKALMYFKNAADLQPSHTDARLKIAELLNGTQDPQLLSFAEQHARAALEQRANDPEALHALGLAEWRQGKSAAAVEHLERALVIDPAHLKSAITLAALRLTAFHQTAAAEQILRTAVEHSPGKAPALVALGSFYVTAGRLADAETQFHQAIVIDPKDGQALLELAKLQEISGRRAEADQTLARLSSLPDNTYRSLHAIFLFQHGQRDAAIAELKRYWERDPADTEVRRRLVDFYLQLNRLEPAEQVLAAALRRNGRDPDALEQQGRLLLRRERFQDAEKSLTEALRIRPESGSAHYLLAQTYDAQGRALLQRQELQSAVERDPALLPARVELAQNLRLEKAFHKALDVIDAAPAAQKQELSLVVERGWVLFALERFSDAELTIRQAMAISRSPAVLMQAGLMALREKKNDAGRALLEEALTAAPEDREILNAIAYSLAAENKMPAAIARVRKQAAAFPQSAPLQVMLASWLEQAGDLNGAGMAYHAATAADAAYIPARIGAARLEMMQGRWDSARAYVHGVLAKDPRNIDGLLALGMLEEATGHYPAAIKTYRALLEIDPAHVAAKNNLVVRLSENPATRQEALLLAQELKQAVPNDPEIDDTAGWAFYQAGHYRTAINYLEDAVQKTKTARPRYHLAMAYFAAGQRTQGQKTLAAAKQQDPALPEAVLAQKIAESTR
jgi:tetratricopeptide (TPR) repeat protein